jgi:hypothetical protein
MILDKLLEFCWIGGCDTCETLAVAQEYESRKDVFAPEALIVVVNVN